MSESVLPMFSSRSFIVSGLAFSFLIHFIFVYVFRKCYSFILSHIIDQFSQNHLLKRLSFLHCIFLPPLSKIRYAQVHRFISGLHFVPLIYISVFVPVPYYLDDCSFVLYYEFRKINYSSSILLCQDCFGYLGSFVFPNCEIICSSSVKNTVGSLIGIALNLQIALGVQDLL